MSQTLPIVGPYSLLISHGLIVESESLLGAKELETVFATIEHCSFRYPDRSVEIRTEGLYNGEWELVDEMRVKLSSACNAKREAECVFRRNPDSESNLIRTRIRSISDTDPILFGQ